MRDWSSDVCSSDLVQRSLREFSPPELYVLGESKEELVAQFIFAKVLQLNTRSEINDIGSPQDVENEGDVQHSAPSNSFALCAYFRRYLIDCTRSAEFRRTVAITDNTQNLLEMTEEVPESIESHLAEFGLTLDSVSAAARHFIAQLGEPERLLLCEAFGKETPTQIGRASCRERV